jgi:hypothetical protein
VVALPVRGVGAVARAGVKFRQFNKARRQNRRAWLFGC